MWNTRNKTTFGSPLSRYLGRNHYPVMKIITVETKQQNMWFILETVHRQLLRVQNLWSYLHFDQASAGTRQQYNTRNGRPRVSHAQETSVFVRRLSIHTGPT